MAYQVGIRRKAQKQIDRMQERDRERVLEAALALGEDPRPRDAAKIRGTGNLEEWRIRIGRNYRVIYRIDDEAREVFLDPGGRPPPGDLRLMVTNPFRYSLHRRLVGNSERFAGGNVPVQSTEAAG